MSNEYLAELAVVRVAAGREAVEYSPGYAAEGEVTAVEGAGE